MTSIPGKLACFSLAARVGLLLVPLAFLVNGLGARTDAADSDAIVEKGGESDHPLVELFDEKLPDGAQWQAEKPETIVRDRGGFAGERWGYLGTRDGNVAISGLSVPIRENPEPGECRYLSFAWRKWGGGQLALQIDRKEIEEGERQKGDLYGYRYDAGEGPAVAGTSLRLSEVAPSEWTEITRDLWQDFGDFTLCGLTFISVAGRDAAFDRIYLAQRLTDFEALPPSYRELGLVDALGKDAPTSAAAPILPAQVVAPVDVKTLGEAMPLGSGNAAADSVSSDSAAPVVLHSDVDTQQVSIDWGRQVMAGGWTMLPLLLLSVAGVVIGVQRLLTVRVSLIAPPALLPAVRQAMARGEAATALAECERHPSTLAEALRFVVEHRQNDVQVVNQAAGDIAARDIRDHMSRIYPLSVIGALAPLLGLLGTIIGMIEAFALVSIYGDEGGATLLSGSISKALITTAAGLVIAIPAIALYYVIKNRLMRITSLIENRPGRSDHVHLPQKKQRLRRANGGWKVAKYGFVIPGHTARQKSEVRMSKYETNSNFQNPNDKNGKTRQPPELPCQIGASSLGYLNFEFRACLGFRAQDFGLRGCEMFPSSRKPICEPCQE